jgi:large subunit ribosomal protein L17
MRHNKKFNHLGRKAPHRKAMLANMASSLIAHKRISTTVAKAKALRMYVEPLITKAKEDTTHSRRVVFSYLQDKDAVSELFREVAAKIADRPGGYTRILKTGNRLGDNAEMCIIELVDYNEAMLAAKEEAAAPKKRRSRRGGAKKADAPVAEVAAPVAETKVVEETKVEEATAATETEVKAEETTEEPKAEDSAEEKKEK